MSLRTKEDEGLNSKWRAPSAREGKLSAAVLDVVNTRVEDGVWFCDSPLVDCENVAFTLHQAGTTVEARARSKKQWVENICRVLNGEKPWFIVNNVWK